MKVIGLTGGIGSGKSTVASFLAEMGAVIIDADKLGHEVYAPGLPAWKDLVKEFGKEILKPDNTIDRAKLARGVFGRPGARGRLNSIMFPRMTRMLKNKLAQFQEQGAKVAVLEATLLVEGKVWPKLVDEIWVTVASEPVVITRLKERSGYSEEESLARIRSQRSDKVRLKRADVVIDTRGSLAEVRAKVKELWEKRIDAGSPSNAAQYK